MPLYEYECESCEKRFERIQKFSDPLVETCPTCGGKVRKLMSSPAIQFKGTGWYITDYAKKSGSDGGKGSRDDGSKDAASKDSGSGRDQGGKDAGSKESAPASSSGESKPAAASTSKPDAS
jgi:putative FmdB family regulatory protein